MKTPGWYADKQELFLKKMLFFLLLCPVKGLPVKK